MVTSAFVTFHQWLLPIEVMLALGMLKILNAKPTLECFISHWAKFPGTPSLSRTLTYLSESGVLL